MDLDKLGIGKGLTLFPEQILTAFDQAMKSNVEKLEFDNVIVSGMGGSSNAAKIIQSLTETSSKKIFSVINDYGLPAWANEKTLVVANSYSGNTEETLSGAQMGKDKNCKLIAVTTGGKLKEMIDKGEVKGAIFTPGETNPSGFPKSGLGSSFGALAGALVKVGFLEITRDELVKALDEIVDIRKSWNMEEVAKGFLDKTPVLFSSRQFLGPLNAGRNATCEIGRTFTMFYDFPEVDHVLVEAVSKPDFIKEKFKYLFFESTYDTDRIKLRYVVTKKIFKEQGLQFTSYQLQATSRLGQALEIPHYCAWLGYHLSILERVDPGPEPWIKKLKDELSK